METENKWISIKEKLPKVGQKVLVFVKSDNNKWSDIRLDEIYEKKGNKYWTNFNGFITSAEITHWMLLPPAPKG